MIDKLKAQGFDIVRAIDQRQREIQSLNQKLQEVSKAIQNEEGKMQEVQKDKIADETPQGPKPEQ